MVTSPNKYDASNWYWVVAGITTRVWSSASASYVPVSDATYLTWLAAGNFPSNILNELELEQVLAIAYPAGWPLTIIQKAQLHMNQGIAITSTSGGWTASFAVLTDPTGASVPTLITSEILALQISGGASFADGTATVQWPDTTGTLRTLNPTQFQAFAKAVASFVALCRNVANSVPNAVLPDTAPITIA